MTVIKIVKWGTSNSKTLFQIDGIGALISAFLLGFVLVNFDRLFGIPKNTLYFLASLPCFIAIYDFCCYKNVHLQTAIYIQSLALINLTYCCLSIGFALFHWDQITILGLLYIISETLIVSSLALIELKIAQAKRHSQVL